MDDNNRSVKKLSLIGLIAVLLVFASSQASLIINPALADLESIYQQINANIAHSDILLLSTITSLSMMIAGPVSGAFVGRKIGYRVMTLAALALILVGGVVPYFIPGMYYPILFSRLVLGIGMGIVQPLGNVLIMKFYSGEQQAKMMGIGTVVMNAGGVLVQMIAGWVCTIDPNATFWVHAYVALPLVGVLMFMPEPERELERELETAQASTDTKSEGKLPLSVYVISLVYGLMFMMFYPLLLNSSTIMISEGIGTAATAGTIASMYTVGGVIAGLIFGPASKALKKFTIPCFLCVYVAGVACGAFASNAVLYMVGACLGGIAIFTIWPAVMMDFGKIVPPDRIGFASGIFTMMLNLGAFGSAYYVGLIANVFGNDSPRLPITAGVVGIAVVGVMWALFCIVKKDSSADA